MDFLSLKDYHRLAMRTSPRDGHNKIDNGMLGLIGETGELVDLLKKHEYQSEPGTPFPMDAAVNELGDVMWYLEELADGMDTSMNAISTLSFMGLDGMTKGVKQQPTVRKIILNLSAHANKIRRAVERNNKAELQLQMRRMLFCCAWLARIAGVPMTEVAQRNIEKLKKRYPDGFDAKVSMARSASEYKHDHKI